MVSFGGVARIEVTSLHLPFNCWVDKSKPRYSGPSLILGDVRNDQIYNNQAPSWIKEMVGVKQAREDKTSTLLLVEEVHKKTISRCDVSRCFVQVPVCTCTCT